MKVGSPRYMDLQYNNPSEHGRNEQIVSQFLLKSLHIVLESRVPSIWPTRGVGKGGSRVKKSERWFHLALGERPSALDSLNFWHRNLMEPMIIDIILVQDKLVETVIERWVVQYEHSRTSHQPTESYYKKTYKKSIILLRSLYTMMRLLPAYRAYRKQQLSSKGSGCGFVINYKVSSFSSPFTRTEEQMMKHYAFFPVEAQQGRLLISVKYRESLADFNLETCGSFPAEIITDYVGSPATDPFRAFPAQQQQRPHSWTSGGEGPFTQHPPAHRSSSSRRRYDFSSSYSPTSDVYGRSFDDSSPPFSPTYLSAPVSIPPNLSDRPPLSPRSTPHESPSAAIRYLKTPSRIGDLSSGSGSNPYSCSSNHKVSRDLKYDSGRSSGLLSSSGSPRIGFSRSSSRPSLQDELDDIDFLCPFIVDDVDTCDSPISGSGKKSHDAAVGALVRMLRTAPPLRQESSTCYSSGNHDGDGDGGLFMSPKTSTDALEELKAYTLIKHLILSKTPTPHQHL